MGGGGGGGADFNLTSSEHSHAEFVFTNEDQKSFVADVTDNFPTHRSLI